MLKRETQKLEHRVLCGVAGLQNVPALPDPHKTRNIQKLRFWDSAFDTIPIQGIAQRMDVDVDR